MLVKCPKCHFSQPEDQYCAQCGVDMVNFTPPQKSAVKSFLSDPLFHLSVVVVVAIIGTLSLYRKNKTDEVAPTKYSRSMHLSKRSISSVPAEAPSANPPAPPQAQQDLEIKPQEISAKAAPPTSTLGHGSATRTDFEISQQVPSASVVPAAKKAKANLNSDKSKSPYKVKVIYAEVSSRALYFLLEESSKSGQFNSFGDYSAGIIPQIQKKLTAYAREITILRSDSDPIEIGKALSWSFNYKSSDREAANQDISLSTYVNLEESDNQLFKGNLEIVRSQKDSVNPNHSNIQKNNYPAVFEILQDGAFFMSGLGIQRADAAAKPDTELLILVQFEKGQ